jgi:hypothetical protein
METKKCIKCTETKPIEQFRDSPRNKDGHRNECRFCEAKARLVWVDAQKAERHAAKLARISSPTKLCRTCNQVLSKELFYDAPVNADGKKNICIECDKLDRHDRYLKNSDIQNEQAMHWQKSNPDKVREIRRRFNARHRPGWEVKYPEKKMAQLAVAYALKTGKLKKESCMICGKKVVEAHHPSYEPEDFLSAQWLCHRHHYRANRLPWMPKRYSKELDNYYEIHHCFPQGQLTVDAVTASPDQNVAQ